ncbi:helix-turn-helix transcriptional regulator [Intrasporangium sp. DVR]|uniref:helix-turn-helix domain-containing protein n=1 Tax=Intrasporangium sp. DVR TaxID=3127867 RepID=UPI00313A692A
MSFTTVATTPFGAALRRWRQAGGTSQLTLAHRAGTTPRHLSFLETGRSRPSRDMVVRLSEALDLSLREANDLFRAAGLAPAHPETPLATTDLAPFSAVVDQMLERHLPYPAYAIDRDWNIVRANAVAETLLPDTPERNVVRLMYAGPWREVIANWADLAWPGIRRLQAEASHRLDDGRLTELIEIAVSACRDVPQRPAPDDSRVLCPHFRFGDELIRTISVVAQFGAARDVTLDELRIELIHPADETADAFFRRRAEATPPQQPPS